NTATIVFRIVHRRRRRTSRYSRRLTSPWETCFRSIIARLRPQTRRENKAAVRRGHAETGASSSHTSHRHAAGSELEFAFDSWHNQSVRIELVSGRDHFGSLGPERSG